MDTLDTTAVTAPGEAAKVKTKKVFVKTFGCQMNVYDSERIVEQLAQTGYAETTEMADADLVVLNTCHIREKATEKVYSDLGRIRHVKEARRAAGLDTVVTVAGCVAQAEGAEIAARAPVVDLVVGPQSYHRLPDLLARTGATKRAIVDTAFPEDDKFAHLPQRTPTRAPTAFLTVQEGCDKFCTFCVVPYTRGMEYSRPVTALETEARRLVERGAVEITLLGQNVNAYHGEGPDGGAWPLARLIGRLAKIDGLERIRYTTSHPRDMTDDLIAAHGSEPKLMPFLHLPVQAGADRILAAMNRKHSSDDYRRTIDRLRKARPDIALTTDIIVGFPGETDGEFQATLDLIAEIGFAQAYSFKFSGRPGTPAAKLVDIVPTTVQTERLHRLQDLLDSQALAFNAGFVGKTLPVLFDKPGRQPGHLVGRTPYQQLIHAEADTALLGCIASVEVSAAGANSLSGVISPA